MKNKINGVVEKVKKSVCFCFDKFKKINKKVKIAILLIVVIAIALLVFGIVKNTFVQNLLNKNYVTSMNEPINIVQKNDDVRENYDISIIVTSFEKGLEIEKRKNYMRIKMGIKNNSDDDSNISLLRFHLLNSDDKIVGMTTIMTNSMYAKDKYSVDKKILLLENHLKKEQVASGYLYFYTSSDDIDKLEIRVPASNKKGYENYYVNLK